MIFKSRLMDESAMSRALTRVAHEIIERNEQLDNVALIGIKRRGVPIAQILSDSIRKFTGIAMKQGTLDITFYRDDLANMTDTPTVKAMDVDFDVTGKNIILVDDVIFTGRTVRAAIEAVFAQGRPQSIQLAVLIDRGHRQLPIRPDYVGKNIPTSHTELIQVKVPAFDKEFAVDLYKTE